MMNNELVQAFKEVNTEQRSGAIAATRGDRSVQFYFENGELLLLDYCEDKEFALLRQYRSYHKIGAEIEAILSQMLNGGQTKTKDFLMNQQVVTQEEVDQITRTLVEDTLCEWFERPAEVVQWNDSATRDQFDTDHSAVKLRIQIPVLLDMLGSRISEREAVRSRVPQWDLVFGLRESDQSPDVLNEMERNLLGVVDGRRTVADIAQGIRESELNTATYLLSLKDQGFIEEARASGSVSGRQSSVSGRRGAVSGTQQGVGGESKATRRVASARQSGPKSSVAEKQPAVTESAVIEDFQVTLRSENSSTIGSRFPIVILLLVVLGVVGGVGYLVRDAQKRQAFMEEVRVETTQAISRGDWSDAQRLIVEGRQLAGNDQSLQVSLNDFVEDQKTVVRKRIGDLEEAVAADRIEDGLQLSEKLPGNPEALDVLWEPQMADQLYSLRDQLAIRQQELEDEARLFGRTIESLLNGGNIVVALARIDEQEVPMIAEAGANVLNEWRQLLLGAAENPRLAIGERESRIVQVQSARPDSGDEEMIAAIQQRLQVDRSKASADIEALRVGLQRGDYFTYRARAKPLASFVAGSDLSPALTALGEVATDLEQRAMNHMQAALNAVQTTSEKNTATQISQDIRTFLRELPAIDPKEELQAAAALLDRVARASEQETAAGELAMLSGNDQGLSEEIATALENRRQALSTLGERSARDLEKARELYQAGQLAEAAAAYQEILDRGEYARTDAHVVAREAVVTIKADREQRDRLMKDLTDALLNDDVEAVTQLGAALSMPRLPILVRSNPPGAEVSKNGTVVGTAPWIDHDQSSDRLSAEYTLSLSGYSSATVPAAIASGGWRLEVDLERSPSVIHDLAISLTSQPVSLDGAVWIVGSRSVNRITANDTQTRYFDGSEVATRPLRSPVYAPVQKGENGLLVATRDRSVLSFEKNIAERQPLAVSTDLAVGLYRSPIVIDRLLYVVASRDGAAVGSDSSSGSVVWQQSGSPISVAPQIIDGGVRIVRADGSWQVLAADTGDIVDEGVLGAEVIAAWANAQADQLTIITRGGWYMWSAEQPERAGDFEAEIVAANEGVVITSSRRVQLIEASGLVDLGPAPSERLSDRPPVRWGNQVAILVPGRVVVLGDRGFSVAVEGDPLVPCVANGDLVIADSSGTVRFYSP